MESSDEETAAAPKPTRVSSRPRAKRLTKAQAALERMKAARDGIESRTEQYDMDLDGEETELYDEVTEEQYQAIVRKRQAADDFVVDDDGFGYADDGEEYVGRTEDMEDGADTKRGSKKGVNASINDDMLRKARRLKQLGGVDGASSASQGITKYLSAASKVVGPSSLSRGPKSSFGKAQPVSLDLDAMLDDLDAAPLEPVAAAPSRQSLLTRPVSAMKARPIQRPAPVSQRAAPLRSSLDLRAVSMGQDEDGGDLSGNDDSGAAADYDVGYFPDDSHFGGDSPGAPAVARELNSALSEPNAPSAGEAGSKLEEHATDEQAVKEPAPKRSRFSMLSSGNGIKKSSATEALLSAASAPPPQSARDLGPHESSAPRVPDFKVENSVYSFEEGTEEEGRAAAAPTVRVQGTAQFMTTDDDGSPCLRMYYLDATEQHGIIYLFGKVMLNRGEDSSAPPQYVSVCVAVDGLERTLLVLPKVLEGGETDGDGKPQRAKPKDVYEELTGVLRNVVNQGAGRGSSFKLKPVMRKYAFNMTDVPREETQWLKVKYLAKNAKENLLVDKCEGGKTYQRIFGASTPLLEDFIIGRKLMGPCWITIRDPVVPNTPKSHCKVEVGVVSPKNVLKMVATATQPLPPPPPVVTMSISMKTIINPQNHLHEVVMLAFLVHNDVQLDGHSEEKPCLMVPWVGLRPLGSSATQGLPKTFPHDMDAALGQAKAKGRVPPTKFNNERDLLSCFFQKLQLHDPDIITAHNLLGFDLDVLLMRARDRSVGHWHKLGRLKRSGYPKSFSGKSNGGKASFNRSLVAGRIMCDTYLGAKEFLRETTYSLTHLSASQLKMNRPEVDPADIPVLFASGSQSIADLAHHTTCDAALVQRLMLKLQLVPLSKQLTCLAGNLWARTIQGNRAERNTFLLLHEFRRLKFVTPEKPGYGKSDGGGKRKKAAYAGGLVLEPKKGLYDDYILLLDFNSLYPSIIQEYNLCFTTIDWAPLSADDSAAGSGNVSGSAKKAGRGGGGPIADDEEEEEEVDVVLEEDSGVQAAPLPDDSLPMGVLPRVIKSLVERRAQVKVMLKRERDPMQRQELDIRQKALKLTANSMYGCLGFGSSRFCAKPIAALITAKGREALQRAVDVTQRECGLEVIYGDTDSVMVSTNSRDIKQVKELGNQVKREVNKLYRSLELDLDGIFKCMLLLKKKKYAALVVVEGADGTITYEKEMKGLDLVRRDWCDLSKDTGRFVLDRILSGEAREEVVNDIHQHLSELADAMRAGQVPIGKYIITKGISKPPQDYPDHKRQPHLQVALAMQKAGMPVNAGNHIPYIICEEPKEEVEIEKTSEETDGEIVTPAPSAPKRVSSLPPAERAYHPDRVLRSEGRLIPDVEWYLSQQVVPPIGRLCEPIEGTNTAMLAEKMGLDSKSFSAGMGAGDEEKADDWAFTPTSRLTDEERFRACDPLIVRCFACKEEHAFLGVFRPVDASYVVLTPSDLVPGLSCPGKECGAPFWGAGEVDACFSLIYQRLSLAIREHQRRYGQAWMICDDTSCGRKTQQLSVCGAACTALGCTGRMNFAYSDSALYEQLKYYETLFDAPRAQERAIERWSLKRSDNTFPLSVEQRAVLDLLLIRIRHEVSNSAYNWIQPSLWSTVFSRKTAE